jgi:hypothetical protein
VSSNHFYQLNKLSHAQKGLIHFQLLVQDIVAATAGREREKETE